MTEYYIGIKKPGTIRFESSNLGIIYKKQENGNYKPVDSKSSIKFVVDKEFTPIQIIHDLDLGYLKEYDI